MEFDINLVRSISTVLSLLVFLGLMLWAFNKRRKPAFEEAAQVPLQYDDVPSDAP